MFPRLQDQILREGVQSKEGVTCSARRRLFSHNAPRHRSLGGAGRVNAPCIIIILTLIIIAIGW